MAAGGRRPASWGVRARPDPLDGCRTINRFKTALPSGRVAEYAYARYFFSNLSADIRGLFCATCDGLGVRCTLSNPRNVSVAHRKSVAVLDALGCAKQ